MDRVKSIERQLRKLSTDELAEFREWYARLDADNWGRQIQADVAAGKLDEMADRALRAHASGQSTKL